MKTTFSRERTITVAAVILFLLALVTTGIYFNANRSARQGLDQEKLHSESLLSARLALEKEIEKVNKEIAVLMEDKMASDRALSETMSQLEAKEKQISQLLSENATVRDLKKQLAELKQLKGELESQLGAMKEQNAGLTAELSAMRETLAGLEARNRDLTANLAMLTKSAADNYRIESTRGKKKQKLTVNAAKTKQLMVSFEVPQELSKAVKFQITTPSGQVVSSDDKELSHNIVDEDRPLLASLSPVSGEFEISSRLEMVYRPKSKLKAGIYKIEITNAGTYIGSCQLRLK